MRDNARAIASRSGAMPSALVYCVTPRRSASAAARDHRLGRGEIGFADAHVDDVAPDAFEQRASFTSSIT